MENLLKEQFVKNGLLNNVSNIQDVLVLRNFSGEYKIPLKIDVDRYGYFVIDVKSIVGSFEIYCDHVLIASFTSDANKIFPVKFCKSSCFVLKGSCGYLNLNIYGGTLRYYSSEVVLPKNNIFVTTAGNVCLYSYSNIDDILTNNMLLINNFGQKCFVQTCCENDVFGVGRLDFVSDVYYCNSINNYSNRINVCDYADDAIFLQNSKNQNLHFVYLNNGKIYFKFDESGVLSDDQEIVDYRYASKLISSIASDGFSRVFGVKFIDSTCCFYIVKSDNSIQKIFETKANNVRIIEFDDCVELATENGYSISIVKYNIDDAKNSFDILEYVGSMKLNNMIDYYEVGLEKIAISVCGLVVKLDE